MHNKMAGLNFVLLSIALFVILPSCSKNRDLFRTEDSLPQSELADYNDNFDKMRADLWARASYLWNEKQGQNFKQADMRFEDGKLVIRTQTGSFSKGGLKSRYVLKGDFDIQLDFLMDFTREITAEYMDQVFVLSVFDSNRQSRMNDGAIIGLFVNWGTDQGYLFSICFINGKSKGALGQSKSGMPNKIDNFKGSFRIVRSGKYVSTLYKEAGATEWTQKLTASVTDNDLWFGFELRNFSSGRTTIRANHSITAVIDRFTINAAQKISKKEN